ncbi:HAMP domain-containing histidine kinase [Flammeovirga pectinis]|uniref:histidine kinase n=1 Tax=Flammeovirga pectinis TaxID=2494373 RepID=A0A3Q9FSW7_9BACT|nr:HAMP domain-containing sensor histidine kinase [Flammeovirga pectinis]AZQ65203.1 HAMP domain-containing histidine kinase [Flammeovirga pectinis]
MVYKQFRLQITLRVFLLLISSFVLSIFLQLEYWATSIFVFAGICYQVFLLLQKLNSVTFEVKKFLDAINYDDFTQTFTVSRSGDIQDELNKSLQKSLTRFKELRADRETDLMFYKSIAQHIDAGLIAFNPDGKVIFSNLITKRIFSGIKSANIEDFKKVSPKLYEIFTDDSDEEIHHVSVPGRYDIQRLVVQKITIYVKGEVVRVFSMDRVQEEVEQAQIEAWEALIKVLTHEMMNAMAPIASLSNTVNNELDELKTEYQTNGTVPSAEDLSDIQLAMNTIEQRANSMSALAEDFRVMAHLRDSEPQHIDSIALCKEYIEGIQQECDEKNIKIVFEATQDILMITADPIQIRTVIDCLCRNSIEELSETQNATITIRCNQDDHNGRPIIQVIDNGSGIDFAALDRIFVPFFTTKKDHTGIGLSLSQQIMRRNNGRLTIKKESDKGAEFALRF